MQIVRAAVVALALSFVHAAASQPFAPEITVTQVIDAPVADVWKAWTTAEGIESFFASRAAKVEWANARAYFQQAWPAFMASREKRFAKP